MSELGEFRLLLTGSRHWLDQLAIWRQLNWWLGEYGVDLIVIHGNCLTGADKITQQIFACIKAKLEAVPA